MGPDYIGPAVDHFQEISYQYPEVNAGLIVCRVAPIPCVMWRMSHLHGRRPP